MLVRLWTGHTFPNEDQSSGYDIDTLVNAEVLNKI